VSRVPSLWGWAYEREKNPRLTKVCKKLLMHFVAMKLMPFVRQAEPDVIVCTHAFSLGALSLLKSEGFSFKLGTALTDLDVNSFWIDEAVDFYLVGNDRMKKKISSMHGVDEERIYVTGIPIRESFNEVLSYEKSHWKSKIGLQPEYPAVLITGGGWGHGPIVEMIEAVNESNSGAQIITVTGNNAMLKLELERRRASGNHRVHVYGYVDNMEEIMGATELLIAKPGGLTSSEALALGVPMIGYKPIPGQEGRNMRFLLDTQSADCAHNPQELRDKVTELLQKPNLLAEMGRRCLEYGKPRSAYHAAQVVLNWADLQEKQKH
jgi:processive 1,2-diacylglycerol beta-glucosyltransferase